MSAPQEAGIEPGAAAPEGAGESTASETAATEQASQETSNPEVEKLRNETRALQSRVDKIQAFANQEFGGDMEKAHQFMKGMADVARRADFADYAQGKLSSGNGAAAAEEDDFRTDEEKRLDQLETRDAARERDNHVTLAEIRFDKAESGMDSYWGNDLWREKEEEMRGQIMGMARDGLLTDPSRIDFWALNRAFLSSFRDKDELDAVLLKHAQNVETRRAAHQEGMSTSAPDTRGGPTAVNEAPPDSMKEAWVRGLRDGVKTAAG